MAFRFRSEFFAFPNSRHDDQVDALSMVLAQEPLRIGWTDEALDGYARMLSSGF